MRAISGMSRFNEAAAYHCGKRDDLVEVGGGRAHASMRPQHITAENAWCTLSGRQPTRRFNEAAAYHCGKRPGRGRSGRRRRGFNEAAAYHCGKRSDVPTYSFLYVSLQ